jgi:hypothetical protein
MFRHFFILIHDNQVDFLDEITTTIGSVYPWIEVNVSPDNTSIDTLKLKVDNEVVFKVPNMGDLVNRITLHNIDSGIKNKLLSLSFGNSDQEKLVNAYAIGLAISTLLCYLLPGNSSVLNSHPQLRNMTVITPVLNQSTMKDVLQYYESKQLYQYMVNIASLFWSAFGGITTMTSATPVIPAPTNKVMSDKEVSDMVEKAVSDSTINIEISCDNCNCTSTSSSSSSSSSSTIPPPPPLLPKDIIDQIREEGKCQLHKLEEFSKHLYESMSSMFSGSTTRDRDDLLRELKDAGIAVKDDINKHSANTLANITKIRDTIFGELENIKSRFLNDINEIRINMIDEINKIKQEPTKPISGEPRLIELERQVLKIQQEHTLLLKKVESLEKHVIDIVNVMFAHKRQ